MAGPGRSLGAVTSTPSLPDPEVLESHQCWELLRSVSVGRLALWVQDHPDIFPINYKVDHGTLVFRAGDGTRLHAALGETPVALEADGLNPDTGVAWSVVVKGQATAVALTQEVLDTVGLLLFPWQAGRKDHFIRIVPTSVTGRRFTVTPPLTWWSPLDDATRAGLE
ncbi:pyridoxamine 5'-phosphate oxidase family protein [Pseudarthrobacter psychrotolerans]|uniref:Pyridoxamine 5'-phosphate oxidase family protein n=1 Tax=Pseudarthrobacter psychrotolerans TaxID=2697569 RepID=A0A6P1NKJ2_9MICC|nr:pyridoxamine 5'-phosphate oxidase family protein [Pseudarthrobacter psychrotolerans]QHK19014.1 pyridoxamine 5'-phosphate oxidase family protein [Pseudarthrobacter psychrotolerans]